MSLSVVRLDGELDFSRKAELGKLLAAAEHSDVAVIDLRDATYLDSSVLTLLMVLKKHMVEQGNAGIVRVAGANDSLQRIFRICGLDKVFELYDSVVQAQDGQAANPSRRRE